MLIGYARVSTNDQNLDMQIDALAKAGCDRIFQEKVSGASKIRPEFDALMSYIRSGDTLVVYKLDRLGRTMKGLVLLAESLNDKGINIKSISESIDSSSAAGRMFFHIICAFAQMERDVIRERTAEGLKAARARGRKGGRHVTDMNTVNHMYSLYDQNVLSIAEISKVTGMCKSSIFKYLRLRKLNVDHARAESHIF